MVVLSTAVVVKREEIRVRRSGGSGSGMAPPSVFFAFFPILAIFFSYAAVSFSYLFCFFSTFYFRTIIMGILNVCKTNQ